MTTSVATPRKLFSDSPFWKIKHGVLGGGGSFSDKKRGGATISGVGFDDEDDDDDLTTELVQLGAERTKNVLILMSDTGGGHRASAESIRDAFRLEYGDEYNVRFSFFV